MSEVVFREMELMVHSFLLGVILMISYDLIRLFRLLIPHGTLSVGIEDFLYWLYCTAMVFRLLFAGTDGVVRGYVILSVFAAMILYDRIVSQTVLGLLKKVKIWFTIKVRRLITNVKIRRQRKKERSHGTEP